MIEIPTESPFPEPARPRPGKRRIDRESRPRIAAYVGVAVVSLALGAGGALLVVGHDKSATPSSSAGPATATTGPHAGHQGMAGMTAGATGNQPAEAGNKAVHISPARQQLIGVRTATVTQRTLDTTIRTVGMLAYDETRMAQIHTKIAGWVERLYVDYVGKFVRRGQPLFTVYSPQLVSTQNEYLLALRAQKELGSSDIPEVRASAESLLSATRRRLSLWDITDQQIEQLKRTGQVRRSLTLYSPFDGVVLERNTFEGQYITPELTTFKLADLSTIWVIGQIFEYEIPLIKIGQDAEIEFPYDQAGRRLKGKITFIYPEIDPQTRRVKVRVEFPNPGFELKPETYVTVLIRARAGKRLAVPKEAVIDTGAKRYVIVALPNGYFEPREIEVGEPTDDYFQVVGGLVEGDKVVSSAQFLIDSESNLEAAMKAMMMSMPGMDMGGGSMEGMEMPKNQAPPEKRGGPPPPQTDHSKHESMPGMKMDGEGMEGMDMPEKQAPAPKQVPPPDHAQHEPAGPEPKMDHAGHGQ